MHIAVVQVSAALDWNNFDTVLSYSHLGKTLRRVQSRRGPTRNRLDSPTLPTCRLPLRHQEHSHSSPLEHAIHHRIHYRPIAHSTFHTLAESNEQEDML